MFAKRSNSDIDVSYLTPDSRGGYDFFLNFKLFQLFKDQNKYHQKLKHFQNLRYLRYYQYFVEIGWNLRQGMNTICRGVGLKTLSHCITWLLVLKI